MVTDTSSQRHNDRYSYRYIVTEMLLGEYGHRDIVTLRVDTWWTTHRHTLDYTVAHTPPVIVQLALSLSFLPAAL